VGFGSFLRGARVLLREDPPNFERFQESHGHPPPSPRRFALGDGLQMIFGAVAAVGGYFLIYGPDG
jgi:hypothetical protein